MDAIEYTREQLARLANLANGLAQGYFASGAKPRPNASYRGFRRRSYYAAARLARRASLAVRAWFGWQRANSVAGLERRKVLAAEESGVMAQAAAYAHRMPGATKRSVQQHVAEALNRLSRERIEGGRRRMGLSPAKASPIRATIRTMRRGIR